MAGLSTGAGADVVKLYHEKSMILPDVSRVLACLREKDVKFSTVKASYKDILRLQATRSVPVPFYDGTTSLQESRAICRYIAETYEHHGYPFLLGKDVLERASIEQWLRHEEHAFDPPSRALFCHLAFQPLHDEDMDAIDREKRKLEEVLEVYEQRLGECEFLAGNKFTLADLVHLPNTHHIVKSEKFAYLYDSRKNVRRWWNTISARDSWQQVVRDMESVEEEYQMEELEQQEQLLHQQWLTEPPPSGGRTIRIDPRKQTGSESWTILVPPPSGGAISSSFFTAPQEKQPPPAKTSRGEPSPIKREESNFFTTTEKTSSASKQRPSTTQKSPSDVHSTGSSFFTSATPPTTTKMPQRTDTDKSTSKDTSSPNRTSQKSSKEATKGLPSGSQYTPQQSKAPPTDLKVSDMSPLQEEYEGTQGAMDGDERFSTKRLRKMLEQSDPAALQSESTDLQAPPKQEETPPVHNKPAHVQDRKGQADNISADGRTDSTPSTGARAPDTPSSADERRAASPPKGGIGPDDRGATEPRKSPSINAQEPTPPVPSQSPTRASNASASSNGAAQDDDLAQLSAIDQWRHTSPQVKQGVPGAPSIDKLDKTTGVDRRVQPNTPKKASIEQSDKTAMDERVPEMKPRQAPPPDTRRTSAPTPPSQKPVSSSQKTAEPIKGVTATSYGGDESASIAMADESASATPPAPPQAPASDGRSVSTALQGSTPEARQKNEAVKPSVVDPRGMPTTPKRAAATPDTQRHTTSDQTSEKAPSPPPFVATRNEKTRIAEAGQTTMIAPNEQLGERALKNTGAPAAGPLPMKSRKSMDEAYSDRASTQQLSSDQSRAQPAENKKQQGGDATLITEFGESKEDDFVENSKKNDIAQAQAADGSSKQQTYSDQNKPISSKDISNEAVYYHSSTTSRDMLPSVLEKSMGKQPMQDDRSSVSLQDDEKQGSEGAPPVYKAEQSKKRGQALPKSEEQTSPDTQQVENNRSGRKSNGSSKPTQFDGNEGDVPESQKGGTSTKP